MSKNHTLVKWGLFLVLSFIWGSSFELMKLGLFENHDLSKPVLTSWQVAAIRLVSAGLVVLPFIGFARKRIAANKLGYVSLSGILGSFFPAFLFTIAETKIDGAFAGALNSLTPVFVILIAFLFFRKKLPQKHTWALALHYWEALYCFISPGKAGKGHRWGVLTLHGFVYWPLLFTG